MTENLKMDVQSRLNDLEDAWFDRADAASLRRIEARVRSRRREDWPKHIVALYDDTAKEYVLLDTNTGAMKHGSLRQEPRPEAEAALQAKKGRTE